MSGLEHEISVLVVDDEEPVREVISAGLVKRGYSVTAANSGQAALDMADRKPFDVILLDVKMPGLTGIEVLRRLKERSPEALVIMLTAVADPDAVIRSTAMDMGAHSFLQKPLRLGELHECIQEALGQQAGSDGSGPNDAEVGESTTDNGGAAEPDLRETYSILVVDDEEAICAVICGALSREGHEVTAVPTGEEALALVSEREFDMVLLDIRMPGMSGLEVLHALVTQYTHIPVVMLTTAINNAEHAENRALQLGAVGLLSKPCTLKKVRDTVRQVCGNRRSARTGGRDELAA